MPSDSYREMDYDVNSHTVYEELHKWYIVMLSEYQTSRSLRDIPDKNGHSYVSAKLAKHAVAKNHWRPWLSFLLHIEDGRTPKAGQEYT